MFYALCEVVPGQLLPDPLLPGDGVHGDAGVGGALHVLRVGEAEQDFADALFGQRVDEAGAALAAAAAAASAAAARVAVLEVAAARGRRGEVLLVLNLKRRKERM